MGTTLISCSYQCLLNCVSVSINPPMYQAALVVHHNTRWRMVLSICEGCTSTLRNQLVFLSGNIWRSTPQFPGGSRVFFMSFPFVQDDRLSSWPNPEQPPSTLGCQGSLRRSRINLKGWLCPHCQSKELLHCVNPSNFCIIIYQKRGRSLWEALLS